ncbi:MAG: hypothetical protein ACON35_02715 [Candidatus Marinamargulisbacteria bacterium]
MNVKITLLSILMGIGTVVHGYPELTEHALTWEGKDKPVSIHATNVNSSGEIGSELFDFPVNSKIYHIWLIAYSQWFADMYGYPNDYVVDMPKGLHVLQLEMGNHRVRPTMSFHLLLDNSLGLDLPTHNITSKFNHPMRFPKRLKNEERVPWWKTNKKRWRKQGELSDYQSAKGKRHRYFDLNTRIATLDYDPIKKKIGASTSTGILMYRNDYFMGMDYVKLYTSTGHRKLFNRPNVSIWLKKKGGRDYRKNWKDRPEEFMKFKIPDEMRKQILQLIDGLPPSEDMNYDHLYRRVYKQQIKQIQGE